MNLHAFVAVNLIHADAAIFTGFLGTLINIDLARRPVEPGQTCARVLIDPVHAGSVIFARLPGALVNIDFALPPREAGCTLACVRVDPVHAEAAILARGRKAFVLVNFAGVAFKTRLALATEFTKSVKIQPCR